MKIFLKSLKLIIITTALFVSFVLLIALWVVGQFPSDKELRGCFTTKLYSVYLCPNGADYVSLNNISNYLVKAVVLTEDSTFWQHQGFDLEEIEKSLKKNIETGKYSRGGSTITQQLAKNLFLTKDKTLLRKAKEAIITLRIEKTLKKKEILERYFNVVQFGKGIFGIKKAAKFYFQKNPSDLDVVESAFLTFLLPSPEKYSVSFFKKELTPFARKRLTQIIENLHNYERITDLEYQAASLQLSSFLNKSKFENQDIPENLNDNEESSSEEESQD